MDRGKVTMRKEKKAQDNPSKTAWMDRIARYGRKPKSTAISNDERCNDT